ncbi:MAG: hypothetical protein ACTSWN_06415 [Promethearchaeota archaeon]
MTRNIEKPATFFSGNRVVEMREPVMKDNFKPKPFKQAGWHHD